MAKHRLHHERFERLAAKASRAAPPCMVDQEDWEAPSWMSEADVPESDSAANASLVPDITGAPAVEWKAFFVNHLSFRGILCRLASSCR
jgi:hypothetical protein